MSRGEFLNHVIPVPQELTDTLAGSVSDPVERARLEAQRKSNLAKYGAADWYDYCVNRWGTKWDVDCQDVQIEDDGLTVTAMFDSAWSPPIGVAEQLMNRGLSVTLYYYEPGMAFVGRWEDGDDFCVSYSDESSQTVRDAIGDELDDMFGISEAMAEWEAENTETEELTEWILDGIEQRKEAV